MTIWGGGGVLIYVFGFGVPIAQWSNQEGTMISSLPNWHLGRPSGLLGGSWRVTSTLNEISLYNIVALLVTLPISTHERPSRVKGSGCLCEPFDHPSPGCKVGGTCRSKPRNPDGNEIVHVKALLKPQGSPSPKYPRPAFAIPSHLRTTPFSTAC